jgi:hypothetical protein
MKKVLQILPLFMAVILLSSCLSSGIDIVVNKDGSGEIIQTFQVQKEYTAFMNLGEQGMTDPNMINREALANQAATMGEGVTLNRVEPVSETSSFAGYKAYFTFTDINKVRTSPTPTITPGEEVDSSEWIRFDFKKGSTSKLIIITPQEEKAPPMDEEDYDTESDSPEMEDEGMMEQMKQIYSTMHFWLKIKVNGNISNTNALYSEGSEISILDMNFGKVVENDELFKHITSDQNADLDEVRDQLEKIGVKIDDQDRIEVLFR